VNHQRLGTRETHSKKSDVPVNFSMTMGFVEHRLRILHAARRLLALHIYDVIHRRRAAIEIARLLGCMDLAARHAAASYLQRMPGMAMLVHGAT